MAFGVRVERHEGGCMEGLVSEFVHPTFVPFSVIAFRLMLAVVLGGAIGFEREVQNRPAGLRTHILTCVAAAMIAVLTIEITQFPVFRDESVKMDPIRLVEAVTAGVAFLAAGLIMISRGEVHGLTTGAGMWLAAGVGLACGLGLWQIAVFGTGLTLVVLYFVRKLENHIDIGNDADLPTPDADEKAPKKARK